MIREWFLRRGTVAEADRRRVAKLVAGLPIDKAWRIELHEYKPRRTDHQNRYLWGVVYPAICKHFEGWRAEDVHEYMLGRHFGTEEIDTMDGPVAVPVRRSKRLTKQEFTDFIATIVQVAGEHSIDIPEPDITPEGPK